MGQTFTTRRRTAYCGAIVRTVMGCHDSATKRRLADALEHRSFESRNLDELRDMAVDFGVSDEMLDRCDNDDNDPRPDRALYKCGRCFDNGSVAVEVDGPDGPERRFQPCPSCNRNRDDDAD